MKEENRLQGMEASAVRVEVRTIPAIEVALADIPVPKLHPVVADRTRVAQPTRLAYLCLGRQPDVNVHLCRLNWFISPACCWFPVNADREPIAFGD